jgi:hypothetical protein
MMAPRPALAPPSDLDVAIKLIGRSLRGDTPPNWPRGGQSLKTMADLMILRGSPTYGQSGHGPEFIATAQREWIGAVGSQTAYIEPVSPWRRAIAKAFNGKLRDERFSMKSPACSFNKKDGLTVGTCTDY